MPLSKPGGPELSSARPDASVTLPRRLVIGGGLALVVLLAAVAFLAGRQSARQTPALALPLATAAPTASAQHSPEPSNGAAAIPPIETPPAASETASLAEPAPPAVGGAEARSLPSDQPFAKAPEPFAPAASHAAPPEPAAAAQREAVARYFAEIEAIQQKGKSWNDPDAFARTLVEQGAKGDGSGFDELLASNRRVRDTLQSVAAPSPCAEHHRLTLALMDETLALLDQLKKGTLAHDESVLSSLAARGKAVETRAREADALASTIKRHFSL